LLKSLETPANLPFARELWMADATLLLKEVNIPTLVIIGKKDIQVDWHADGDPLQLAAAGNDKITFLFPDNANHLLKYEPQPRAELVPAKVGENYNSPDAHLEPETLSSVIQWLTSHTVK
jgi:fermentation-respiration switch protein FrsA (DUF1100 family)